MYTLPLSQRLVALGQCLKADGYFFCTPTPLTQARVLARKTAGRNALRDIFGWNKPIAGDRIPQTYRRFLDDPEFFRSVDGRYQARVRFSQLGPLLLAHSGFPTDGEDAVFFGPDTYRFAHAIEAFRDRMPGFTPKTCLDIGAGSGAGGLWCAALFPSLKEVALLDINDHALEFAKANIALNGITPAEPKHSDILAGWEGPADLIISNPPYLVDSAKRAYRHGGGVWGATLSVRILEQALAKLSPQGHLLLYTGTAIADGCDMFLAEAQSLLDRGTVQYRYQEIDPDVFGEELDKPPYDQVDRIATVMLHVKGSDLKR